MDDPSDPSTRILTHLSKTLSLSPPQSTHPPATLTGLPTSHTGTAYLFLSVSAHHPRLQVHSYPAIHWARAYISNIPTPSAPLSLSLPHAEETRGEESHGSGPVIGLLSDALAGPAIRACVTKDLVHVRKFLALLAPVLEYIVISNNDTTNSTSAMEIDPQEPTTTVTTTSPPLPSCLFHGLAGTLYLLRLIRHWVPSSAPLVCGAIVHVSDYLLSPSPWTCPSHHPPPSAPPPPPAQSSAPIPEDRYGTAHGDLGIITQLVLTSPPLAPSLTDRLAALLDLQLPNGDWPSPPPPSFSASSPRPQEQEPPSDPEQSSIAPPTPDQTPTNPHNHATPTHHPTPSPSQRRGFASGPQGLVLSLLSLRPFFPRLHSRIDDAVERARAFLWAQAVDPDVLPGEASLFYGSLSTALTFPKGPQRTHLLQTASTSSPQTQHALSPPSHSNTNITPTSNTNTNTTSQTSSTPSAAVSTTTTTTAGSVTTSPNPGSAWLHAVCERDLPRMIFYNDI
ncbi:abscisic acid ABA receptor [Colletotrichum orchidophilum]|uniref:Abscisic acid ABA receptor n=1 Tax=Colletotrichum orchidophilum TaxID=1209926 RepID=A0A1G4BD84_9PEZI|nr:abscisic acid ABA receptor [Colletotrichum orchidophilum]OHE99378.1 abscisic acid ABA receptor [Colletotrichum orchidophilum]